MAKRERMRQDVSQSFGPDEIARRSEEGWKLVAVEWERELPETEADRAAAEVPFGLRIASDAAGLEEDPREQEILALMMALTVQDGPYSAIADELNRRGYRTRRGHEMDARFRLPNAAAADRSRAEDLRYQRMAREPSGRGQILENFSIGCVRGGAPL